MCKGHSGGTPEAWPGRVPLDEATLVGQLKLKKAWAGCPVVLCAQGILEG